MQVSAAVERLSECVISYERSPGALVEYLGRKLSIQAVDRTASVFGAYRVHASLSTNRAFNFAYDCSLQLRSFLVGAFNQYVAVSRIYFGNIVSWPHP